MQKKNEKERGGREGTKEGERDERRDRKRMEVEPDTKPHIRPDTNKTHPHIDSHASRPKEGDIHPPQTDRRPITQTRHRKKTKKSLQTPQDERDLNSKKKRSGRKGHTTDVT